LCTCACIRAHMNVCLWVAQMKALLGRVSAPSHRPAPRCADNNRNGENTADRNIASNAYQEEEEDRESRGNFADQSCNGSKAGNTAELSESMRDADVQGSAGKMGEGKNSKREFLGNRESEREKVCKFVLEIIAQERQAKEKRTDMNNNAGREQEASQHVADRYQLPGLGDKVDIRGKQDKDETSGINESLPLCGIDSLRKPPSTNFTCPKPLNLGVKDGSFLVQGPPSAAKPDDDGSRGPQIAGDREMKIVGAGLQTSASLQTSAAWGLVQDILDKFERGSESPPRSEDKRITGSPKSLSSGLPSPLSGDAPARAPSASPGGEKSALRGLIGLEESKPCLHDFTKEYVVQGVKPLSSTLVFPQEQRLSAERERHVKDAASSPAWIRETTGAHQPSNKARVGDLRGEGEHSLLKRMDSTPSFNREPQFREGVSLGAEWPWERKTGVPPSFSPFPLEEYSNNPQVWRTMRVTKTNGVEVSIN